LNQNPIHKNQAIKGALKPADKRWGCPKSLYKLEQVIQKYSIKPLKPSYVYDCLSYNLNLYI
jgi:hypothetical protein